MAQDFDQCQCIFKWNSTVLQRDAQLPEHLASRLLNMILNIVITGAGLDISTVCLPLAGNV